MGIIKIVSFIFCFLSFSTISAQFSSFDFKNKSKQWEKIDFELIHNLVVIPVFINDSDTLRFVLDTGVQNTLVTELPPGDSVRLNYGRELTIAGLGNGEPVNAIHSWGNSITVGSIIGQNQDIIVLLENTFFLSTSLGIDIHGLIGYDLLKNFIVDINYENKYVLFTRPERYVYKKNYQEIPLNLARSKPYIDARIVISEDIEVETKMLIDMGASYAASLYTFSDTQIKLPEKTIRSFLGKGLNGDIFGDIGRAKWIKIGPFTLNQPVITFPDSASVIKATEITEYNGSIGSDVLNRFHVTFDYPNSRIFLKPNRYFKRPFVYNLSGLELIAPVPGLRVYLVEKVRESSSAMRSGLIPGDLVEKINGERVYKYSINEIMDLLNRKPGRKILITVRRGNKIHHIRLVLKDLI